MTVKEVVIVSDNDSYDIEFRKGDIINGNVVYSSIEYENCKNKEVIGLLAKNNKLIIII